MTRLIKSLAGKKSLVCFLTAGDPSLEVLPELVLAVAAGGATAVEIGIPFSDPIADGPVIQASSQRALDRGTRVADVFRAIRRARDRDQETPVIIMTYYNPVLRMGIERFAEHAVNAGADGVIITDLTPEEADPWCEVARNAGLATVFLVAPTSTEQRIKAACALTTGFVYCVSRTGVTGEGDADLKQTERLVKTVRAYTDLPALVGFGVRSAKDVRRLFEFADGAIVGSALVTLLHEHEGPESLAAVAERFVRGLLS